MSNAKSQRYTKSGASQSRTRLIASQSTRRGGFRACTNIFHFSPPGVSLPPTGAAIEGTGCCGKPQDRLHSQALSDFSRETPGLCIFDRADLERHRQPCCYEVAEPRVRTCLKNRRMASGWPFGWNIGLIGWRPKSSLKLMNCWYANDADSPIVFVSVPRRS